MLSYLIEFGSEVPGPEIFEYQDLDIIDLEKLQDQMNLYRTRQRKLLDLYDSLQRDLIMYNKQLSKKTLEVTSDSQNTRDKNQKLSANSDIVELKDAIEGLKMSMNTVARELDFIKSDIYILRSAMYQK